MPWISAVDDERGIGNSIIVTLKREWEFESEEPGCGVKVFDTVAEVRAGCARREVRPSSPPNSKGILTLTSIQAAHVAAVYPECKAQMANYLAVGVEVVVGPQTECGPDVPPIAIAVASDQAFWIDCCETVEVAKSRAQALGLRVVDMPWREQLRASRGSRATVEPG